MHGAFIVNKPVGLTSSDCVTKIKRALIQNLYTDKKIRIGHGGTLDPFATGVLIVLFGEATKLADTYLHSKKTYSGIITLGTQTTTADITGDVVGEVIPSSDLPNFSAADWQKLADQFVEADYLQTPPMYSAKKKDGVAMYELARKGIEVAREALLKKIYNYKIAPIIFAGEAGQSARTPELAFEVECESGTYVRTLAEDLAKKAGTVAHLKTLCRSQSSDCLLGAAITLDALVISLSEKIAPEKIVGYRSLVSLGGHIPNLSVTESESLELRHGNAHFLRELCNRANGRFIQNYVLARMGEPPEGRQLVALLSKTNESLFRVQRIFNPIIETVSNG